MTTTLIVRDATLAVHGAPEKRAEPREHLRLRCAEVAHLDPRTAGECAEVLGSVAGGEGADPEVLEALLILGLAHPRLAKTSELAPLPVGRRLATRLERDGEIEHAMAVLEVLLARYKAHEALERDMAQLMRRQGMVKDLVGRYFERAKRCIAEGRPSEAAGWLREVLQLDPGRKDAARLIRDLRFKKMKTGRRRSWSLKLPGVLLLAGVAGVWLAQRELALAQEFEALPQVIEGNTPTLERRLSELEEFVERHPLWHGTLSVLSERAELRVRLAVLADKARQEREQVEFAGRQRLQDADLSRSLALHLVQGGDVAGAAEAFRRALEYGGPGWEHHERVARDLAELEAHLSETP